MNDCFSKIRFIVAIAAGKGGVGKSSLTTLLAEALDKAGYAVGVLDADLYGPSIGHMMPAEASSDSWTPRMFGKIKVFSMDSAMHARAPVVNALLLEAIQKVKWGELDYLLVDFPPGTGDIQLTLLQNIPFAGVVLLTLPQEISLIDVRKAAKMFPLMGVPILGVIENMSYYQEGDKTKYLFGKGGGERLSLDLGAPLLEEIPINPLLCESLDNGRCFFSEKIDKLAEKVQRILCNLETQLSLEGVRSMAEDKWQIVWSDGKISQFHPHYLQKLCPCKGCREGINSSSEDVQILSVSRVGKYALKVAFSKGCNRGFFPFALLRSAV